MKVVATIKVEFDLGKQSKKLSDLYLGVVVDLQEEPTGKTVASSWDYELISMEEVKDGEVH